ncbi:MAG: nucleotidyl transferase AbiEii/AbiGii toxin family protein [Hydrotalea sp.]|nr:nucleotidyl transferase AbiEii/AbiGii toxin family protein [Hydrotalea sp.]
MRDPIFDPFRLVGGTALSLYFGHRMSVDIDLFTDAPYGTIDFDKIESWLK